MYQTWIMFVYNFIFDKYCPTDIMMASFFKLCLLISSSDMYVFSRNSGLRYVSGIWRQPGNRTWQISGPDFSPNPYNPADIVPLCKSGLILDNHSSALALEMLKNLCLLFMLKFTSCPAGNELVLSMTKDTALGYNFSFPTRGNVTLNYPWMRVLDH